MANGGENIELFLEIKEREEREEELKILIDKIRENLEKIEEIVKDENATMAGYLDINVVLKADDIELGNVTKLSKPISISLEIDKKYTDVPKGYTRKYFVIRLHEGENPTIIDAEIKDGKLEFKTNKFSTYAIAYKDTVSNGTNPKTFDELFMWILLISISMIGLGIQTFKLRKISE